MSRIALITGTSTGIGLSSAIHLAQEGFQVVATLRDPAKATALRERAKSAGVTLDIRALDVCSDSSVETCVKDVLAHHGRIDVLVNNAGAGLLGTMEQTSQEALRQTMEVNFFGVWRVTQAVFASMREARSGRILTVTSVGGLIGQPFNDAYCAAKFACEGFLESLAPVAQRLGIHVSNIEPGPVHTEFVSSVLSKQTAQAMPGDEIYKPMLKGYMDSSVKAFSTMGQTPDDIAKVIVEVATTAQPHLRYATSEMMRGFIGNKYADTTGNNIVKMMGSRLPPV